MALLRFKFEMYLGATLGWVDISTYVRHQKVNVVRGTGDESPKLTPAKAKLTLENGDDRFNPRNPTGPYYGQLVRNTPIRIAAGRYGTVKGLWTSPSTAGGASAPDSVGLSVTGDLDLRAESPVYQSDNYWVTKSGAYALRSSGGFLQLQWLRTSATITRTSTAAIPAGHTAFRATLDVDNGAAGHTVVFYTAANWGDPWVQLGASVVTAGTTAVDDSTGAAFLGGTTTDTGPLCVRQAEIRSGIGGTVVGSPNPAGQADGTTSWADAQGNTWTVNAASRIGSGVPWYSFYGEVFAFAPRWNEDRSDCTVPIEASGALRRIIANDVQPRSYYRSWVNTHTLNPTPKYFWALEEGIDAGTGAPDIGQGGAWFTNTPVNGKSWGQAKMNDWMANGVQIDNLNTLSFPCDLRGSTSAAWELTGFLTFSGNETTCQIEIDCATATWFIQFYSLYPDWTEGDALVIGPDGSVSVLTGLLPPLKDCGPVWFTFRAYFTGGAINAYISVKRVSDVSNTVSVNGVGSVTATAHVYPRNVRISASANTATPSTATSNYVGLSALSLSECSNSTAGFNLSYTASKAAPGETTDARFTRMCTERGINNTATAAGAVALGRQYLQGLEDHLLEVLSSSAHGAIVESRAANSLALLGTGTHRGTISYSEIVPDLEPTEDDKNTANIVRLDNSHSGQATVTKTTGEMSTAAIGPFEKKLETNTQYFSHAASLAGSRLALGTWAGPRFTEITVSAVSTPARYDFYQSIEVGDFASLDLSAAGYHDLLIVKVTSVQESISQEDHRFTFTVRPGELDYRLWTVGTNRVDIADSTVAVASSGTTLDVNVPSAKWSSTAVPFDVMVSGERMTVTAVSTLTSTTQRLTVTRAVNGVAKTAPVGATVTLYPAFFIKAV